MIRYPLKGKCDVVEDIIDSGGHSIVWAEILMNRNPKSLKICTLLDKPDRRSLRLMWIYKVYHTNAFVVGYGLDYAQRYRKLRLHWCDFFCRGINLIKEIE